MEVGEARRAVAAATSIAADSGLEVGDAVVLSDSNRLVARLLPCDTVVRASPAGWFGAAREVEVGRRLAQDPEAPVAGPDPRVEARVVGRDGFEIGFWSYFEPEPSRDLAPDDYSHALERLHRALRRVVLDAPPFTDRLRATRRWLADADLTPDLGDDDRALLLDRLAVPNRWRAAQGAPEQLLHGEPHPGNLLVTTDGLRFVDFENCARGPVELDLAWVPDEVSARYLDVDHDLIADFRTVVVALIAAHRWRRDDRHPSGRESGVAFLDALRAGPPCPAIDAVRW